jgi:hypothetical protein
MAKSAFAAAPAYERSSELQKLVTILEDVAGDALGQK